MRKTLKLHPESRCAADLQIEVDVLRPRPGVLTLRYAVCGQPDSLSLPPVAAPERRDELWRHTCFEVFLRAPSGDAYFEFNFAPSTCWAAYGFNGYRTGMRPVEGIAPPCIEIRRGGSRFELGAALELDSLPLPRASIWRLGLSAVIEEADGNRSYWALAHPPGKPDFHHSDGFALELSQA